MKPRRAIVTVAISEGGRIFGPYIDRFRASFAEHGAADEVKVWHREWPPNSPPHRECHYAFKVHAIREAARRGFTSVLWFDVSCHLAGSLEPVWERLEHDGHLLLADANWLGNWSSDHAIEHFGVSRDEAMGIHLMCGAVYGLDLRSEQSRAFLDVLSVLAVPEHFNGRHDGGAVGRLSEDAGSADLRVRGHRSDEVYGALLARRLGMEVHPDDVTGRGALVRGSYDISLPPGGLVDIYDENRPRRARKLEVVAEHTVDVALIEPGGCVLDAGCRDFSFARNMAERGCRVLALDADPTVEDQHVERVTFANIALDIEPGEREFVMSRDPQARHLRPPHAEAESVPIITVSATTIGDFMSLFKIELWECVKLDIEGAEYGILLRWPGPIAKQISVEFHDHVFRQSPDVYDQILTHLGQWYEVVRHERDERHSAGFNYWDSLFVLR